MAVELRSDSLALFVQLHYNHPNAYWEPVIRTTAQGVEGVTV